MTTPLISAIRANDIERVRKMLYNEEANANIFDGGDFHPLIEALKISGEMAEAVIKRGYINLNTVPADQRDTLLELGLKNDATAIFLATNSAPLQISNNELLTRIINNGLHLDTIKFIAEFIGPKGRESSPLGAAIIKGDTKILEALLEAGFNPNSYTEIKASNHTLPPQQFLGSSSAVTQAMVLDKPDIVNLLLTYVTKDPPLSQHPLVTACTCDAPLTMHSLLNHQNFGWTSLTHEQKDELFNKAALRYVSDDTRVLILEKTLLDDHNLSHDAISLIKLLDRGHTFVLLKKLINAEAGTERINTVFEQIKIKEAPLDSLCMQDLLKLAFEKNNDAVTTILLENGAKITAQDTPVAYAQQKVADAAEALKDIAESAFDTATTTAETLAANARIATAAAADIAKATTEAAKEKASSLLTDARGKLSTSFTNLFGSSKDKTPPRGR